MLLQNKGVNLLFKHSSSIINIFHLDFDSPKHFLSLSDNSEIIEFLFLPEEEKAIEIEKFHLKRPDNELLEKNGHKIINLKHGQYHKITQVIQFDSFITLGYDDGLILVYQITKKEFDNEEQNKPHNHELKYFNSFSLYYILLGHLEEIVSLCYIPQIKMLISSSLDNTLKMFDFETGNLTHFFKFDFIINRIMYQNTSKKGDPKIILTLLSQSPVKVSINLSANPITCNTLHFDHIDILQLEKINDKFYGMTSKNIKILDKNLEQEGNLISLNNSNFLYFNKYKNDFLIVDDENMVKMVKPNLKSKNKAKEDNKNDKNKKKNAKNEEPQEDEEKIFESVIQTQYKFKVGEDNINGFYFIDNFILAFTRDGCLYLINYDKIQESYENGRMKIEDEESQKMMENAGHNKKTKKGKKDKKAKGKKEKKKKK